MGEISAHSGNEYYGVQSEMPEEALNLMEQYAYDFGQGYDSYLITENNREYFFCKDRRGVIGFKRRGRFAHVVGGLLSSPEDREILLEEFTRFSRDNNLDSWFYCIDKDEINLFRGQGYQVTKGGEEPLINLKKTDWRGKNYEWVRRQENYCLRKNVIFQEIDPNPEDRNYIQNILPQIKFVSHSHLENTLRGKSHEFFISQANPLNFGRRRIFVAYRDYKMEAYIVCNPCLGGNMWAVETYRKLPDAPRGVVPFLIIQTMRKLKLEGKEWVSLSLVPFVRCEKPMENDSCLLRTITVFWWNYLNWIFDMQGIYHFKSRFRPQFREKFIAVTPKVTLCGGVSFLNTWKFYRANPWRLLKSGINAIKKRSLRRNLAKPPEKKEKYGMSSPKVETAPWYQGRMWEGMTFRAWIKLLIKNRFDLDLKFIPAAFKITLYSLLNSSLFGIQQATLGRRIRKVQLKEDPLFIIGHWRTGTTLMHELLASDPNHRSPTTYESLSPNHFLLTEFFADHLRYKIPS
ncbi:MAG: phosphatidylglycerol lysyltransferase domain-containing protein [bacterium]|nr:phosphatidylglycerol lysyltransferase domain-containing protein [bacterium]